MPVVRQSQGARFIDEDGEQKIKERFRIDMMDDSWCGGRTVETVTS